MDPKFTEIWFILPIFIKISKLSKLSKNIKIIYEGGISEEKKRQGGKQKGRKNEILELFKGGGNNPLQDYALIVGAT